MFHVVEKVPLPSLTAASRASCGDSCGSPPPGCRCPAEQRQRRQAAAAAAEGCRPVGQVPRCTGAATIAGSLPRGRGAVGRRCRPRAGEELVAMAASEAADSMLATVCNVAQFRLLAPHRARRKPQSLANLAILMQFKDPRSSICSSISLQNIESHGTGAGAPLQARRHSRARQRLPDDPPVSPTLQQQPCICEIAPQALMHAPAPRRHSSPPLAAAACAARSRARRALDEGQAVAGALAVRQAAGASHRELRLQP